VLQHRAAAGVFFMAWFRFDTDLMDHPDVFRLARLLNEPLAGWYYVRLLAWMARYPSAGRSCPVSRSAIEHACSWRGDPGELFKAISEAGIIDELDLKVAP